MTAVATSLHELREALKAPIPTVEDFTSLLSSTLDSLGIQVGRKGISAAGSSSDGTVKALDRYLGSIQQALLSTAVPTFLHALDDRGRHLLDAYFCPEPVADVKEARIRTRIALSAYQSLSAQLSVRQGVPPLPIESRGFALDTLQWLASLYGLKEVYGTVWETDAGGADAESSKASSGRDLQWEEAVRVLVSLPAKVSNSVGRWKAEGWKGDIPAALLPQSYFDRLIADFETIVFNEHSNKGAQGRLRQVLERLAAIGLLVPKPTRSPTHSPSLLPALLPRLLSRFQTGKSTAHAIPELFLSLPTATLDTFVDSLLSHLVLYLDYAPTLEPSNADSRILVAIQVLTQIIGPAKLGEEAWDAIIASMASRKVISRPEDATEHARNRLIVGWVAASGDKAVKALADVLLDKWTDAKWIRFSPFSTHFQSTHLLILCLGHLRPYHPYLMSTSTSGRFLMSCQSYLAHPDGAVRRMGMLVAEILSALTTPDGPAMDEKDETEELMKGLDLEDDAPRVSKSAAPRRLKFSNSMWEGSGEGREEARWLRSCLGVDDGKAQLPPANTAAWLLGWDAVARGPPPAAETTRRGRSPSPKPYRPASKAPKSKPKPKIAPKVVMLDEEDDPLSGYSSASASSSRSPSPTPSYLEEVANDPTLALESTDKKKVSRPVYVPQLLALLRDKDNPNAIEMALNHGEALVRAKRSYGTEVGENAISLLAQLVGMNDAFNLDDFDQKRDMLTRAVVACAPKQTAPYLAEQYFTNQYSLQQRSVMLTALSMAARELAGLHIPKPAPHTRRIDFPSKTLPLALHRQYISPADQVPQLTNRPLNQIDMVSDEIRNLLLSKGAKRAEEAIPDIARTKRLRVGSTKSHAVAEEGTLTSRQMGQAAERALQAQAPKPVIPFREVAAEYFILPLINNFWQHYQDTAAREARAVATGANYRGAGAGMILSPLALERFLLTLGLLVHAARHASVFLSVIVPETLELAVTIGSKHFTRPDDHMISDEVGEHDGSKAEGQVVSAALELALVCLDGAVEVDQGRTLAIDKPELVLAAGEWAQGVFDTESRGGKVAQGQAREGKIKAAAAGVVVKVADIAEKWTRIGAMMRQ